MARRRRNTRWPHRGLRTVLVLGFLALAGGILAARAAPANGYESSIYAATPDAFWFGVGIALVAAVLGAAFGDGHVSSLGVVLGGTAVIAVGSLPVIRGYRFYGLADSLTHLGWAREIAHGLRSVFELLYPGNHLQSILITAVGGIPLTQSMMLVVIAYLVVFVLFVPLTIRVLVPDRTAVLIGAFSAFLFLPFTNVGTHRMFHPFTLATLMFPFVLFLLFKHTSEAAEDGWLSGTSAAGLVLPVVTASLLFVHPQTTMNVIIFLWTIAIAQSVFRRYRPVHRISQWRGVYGQAIFLTALFFVWTLQFWQTYTLLEGLMLAVVSTVTGSGQVGAVVGESTRNAPDVGAGIVELFVKLFFVSAIYVALAGGLVLAKLTNALGTEYPDNHAAIAYFTVSGVTLVPFFLAHYLGSISHYFFRHVGFAMVFATILGAIALYTLTRGLGTGGRRLARPVAVIGIVALLVLSLVAVYPSPYVYKRNHHGSDQLMLGYHETFAHQPSVPSESDEAVWYLSVIYNPTRYADAYAVDTVSHRGGVEATELQSGLLAVAANRSDSDVDRDFYLPISEMTRVTELDTYKGFRYSEESFEGVDAQPGVHRIRANGGYTLYYVDSSESSSD